MVGHRHDREVADDQQQRAQRGMTVRPRAPRDDRALRAPRDDRDVVSHAESVRASLADQQWDVLESGQLTTPAGQRFTRSSSRIKRRDADVLIAAGVPLVLYWYGGQQLDYFDGSDAVQQWQAVRAAVTSQAPQLGGEVVWTGGRWVSADDQELLVLTGQC